MSPRIFPSAERRTSLAARLTVWYAAAAFLLVAVAGWIQYHTLATSLAAEDDQLLLETMTAVRRSGTMPVLPPGAPAAETGPFIRELDATCREIRGGWPAEAPPVSCTSAAGVGVGVALASADPVTGAALGTWRSRTGTIWRIAAGAPDANGRHLEVALKWSTDQHVLAEYRRKLSAVLAMALLLASAFGYAIARRGLRPLRALAARIEAVDARSLHQRLDVAPAPAEVHSLVVSFDAMSARLEGAFAALTQCSAELAHELRTPIHVLRQQTEVALGRARSAEEYRELLGSNLEEFERLRRLVDDTLFLARAEDPRATVARTALDVRTELAGVAEYLEALATEAGVRLDTDAPARLIIQADRTLFRRALVNLVTNAIRHTPSGGRVTLAARADRDAVVVEVRDTGEGIPADALERAFDRYFRVPGAADKGEGAGLGLAIVRSIMHLHGGTATLRSEVGAGTVAMLSFP